MNLKYYRETDVNDAKIVFGPKEIHGQLRTYQKGCRCQECRTGNARITKKRQNRKLAELHKELDEKIALQFGVQK